MPYIKPEIRSELDEEIKALSEKVFRLHKNEGRDRDGMLNYAFTKLLLQCYPSVSYRTINECVGLLECTKLEFYRRLAAPYETQKAFENSDIFPNQE